MLLMKILGANKSETETVPESEMEQYLQEPQKVQVHPFKWWKDQSCECLFSTAWFTIHD